MRALLKQSSQLTFLAPGAPAALPLDLLHSSSRSDPSSAPQWQRSCVWPGPATGPLSTTGLRRGTWGNLFLYPRNWNLCGCLVSTACVCLCVRESKNEGEREVIQEWIYELAPVAIHTPNLMWRAMIQAHFHSVDTSWSRAGRSTVRAACQPANSHHQRNYIHKHGRPSCRVPFDLLLTLIWAFRNICCRSFHLSVSLRSRDQITRRSPVSLLPSQNKDILSTNRDWYSVIL